MSTPIARLRREEALLLVVDVQERLLPAMFEAERLARQCALLAAPHSSWIFPLCDRTYPEKLGATIAPLAEMLGDTHP
jgi:hypothetical protein